MAMLAVGVSSAQPATDLWLRGYSVIPSPRNVRLSGGDIVLDSTWRLEARENHIAIATLLRDLEEFHSLKNRAGGGPVIRLTGDRRHRRGCGNRPAGLSSEPRR